MKFIILILILIFGLGFSGAYAMSFDYQNCPCFVYNHSADKPPFQTNGNSNFQMDIHTPTGQPLLGVVLSNDNFTALKNNVAVMAVTDIHTVNIIPQDYCPIAKYVLENQGTPQYLNKFYNSSKNLDLTGFIYPKYCHIETGKNTINGDNSITAIPEFPTSLTVLILSIGIYIIWVNLYYRKK